MSDTEHDWLEGNDSRTEQENEPSAAMRELLDAPVTFDPLRDPTWQPSRGDYASMVEAARSLLRDERATNERLREALRGLLPPLQPGSYLVVREGDPAVTRAREALEAEKTLAALDRLDQENP